MAFEFGIGNQPIVLTGVGGLNTAMHQADIGESELSIAYNFWFEPSSGKLTSRAGLSCVSVTPATSPIEILHTFTRKDTESWLVGVSGFNLEYFDFDTSTWVFLATLESELPILKTFNGNLYIADGSSLGILKWNGTDEPARLADSPQATTIFIMQNRLVANSVADSELDAVYLSGPETDSFDTTTDGGLIIRAGFGDGQRVNGFSAISKTLIVSKSSYIDGAPTEKTFYGIDMSDATPGNWIADYVSKKNSAIGPYSLSGFNQDVVYLDTQGLESLGPTQQYGDIATDPLLGGKVNNQISGHIKSYKETAKILPVSNLAALVIILGPFTYTLSNLTKGFTELSFETEINSMVDYGDEVFLAGDSGHLYKFENSGKDEVSPDVFYDFSTKVRFKMIQGAGQLLLTRSDFDIQYINSGTYKISAVSSDRPEARTLQTIDFETPFGNKFLYSANEDLYDATYDLNSGGSQRRIPCRARFRGDGIAVEITTKNNGRISIGKATLTIANVGK